MSSQVKLYVSVDDDVSMEVEVSGLYIAISAAAEIAGVSYEMMSNWANDRRDPIPHILTGRKKLIRVSAIHEYGKKKEAQVA